MQFTTLPGTNLHVATICLGTAGIGSTIERDASFELLDAYRERGGNFLDTALVYANWLPIERNISEKTIGQWLKQRGCRDSMVVSTKGAHPDLATMHIPRLSSQDILHDIHASLAHLGVDTIDLYWLHRDDPSHPVEDIVETLNDQIRAGSIRAFGCSNWRAPRIAEAQMYAAQHGLHGFVADQMLWSLAAVNPAGIADKTIVSMDDELIGYHRASGLPAIPFSSQANGLFSKIEQGKLVGIDAALPTMYNHPENWDRFTRLQRLSGELSLSVTALALAYLQAQPFPTIPIVGCRTVEQLNQSLEAADLQLTLEQVAFLNQGSH